MRIAPDVVQQIRERADIVEVVNDFVSLKKKGSNWMACCPFHHEKTPSFSVSPSRGIYKCFGCGRGGDAVSFVMEIDSVGYGEALRYLAKKYGIEIALEEELTDEEREKQNEKDSIYIAMNYARDFFREQLWETDDGKAIGLSYFKERGFIEKTIQTFELGYSPSAWQAFTNQAESAGYGLNILSKAGLTIAKEDGKKFDRFRERVMFPIHNLSGRVVAFGARLLKKDPKQAKYLNSPETPVYTKSKIVYGIYQAKKSIREADECYLVEGYTDVISLHQAGIENVVASSGTSLTTDQIRLIKRFSDNITILYDGDNAGIKAAIRGVDLILEEGLNVQIVILPEGEDPDSYVKSVGESKFREFIQEHSQDFIRFKASFYQKEAENNPLKRAEAIRELVNSISKIPDAIKRAVFFQETAKLLDVDEQVLLVESNKITRQEIQKPKLAPDSTFHFEESVNVVEEKEKDTAISPILFQEKESIRLLLNYAHLPIENDQKLLEYFLSEIDDISFETPIYNQILELFKAELQKGNLVDAQFFLHVENEEIKKAVIDLITPRHEVSENWQKKYKIIIPKEEDLLQSIAYKSIMRLKLRYVRKAIQANAEELMQAKTDEEQDDLLMVGMQLKDTEKEIAKLLGNVILK